MDDSLDQLQPLPLGERSDGLEEFFYGLHVDDPAGCTWGPRPICAVSRLIYFSYMAANELIFLVEEAPEGGFTARALGASIFTEADDMATLHAHIRDAVRCHFDDHDRPPVVRLHFVRQELLTI
jgi:hypothetical protein